MSAAEKDGKLPSNEKFCVLVGFYMDRKAGERLLLNLQMNNIVSYWVDSRVEGFPRLSNDPEDNSNDGLRELIVDNPLATLVSTPAEPKQPGFYISEMFQALSEMGYEYVMVMGCDEYLLGDFNLMLENLEKLNLKEPAKIRLKMVEHNNSNNNIKHIAERIIFMPNQVYVSEIHWVYYHGFNGKEEVLINSPLVLGMELHHDDSIREPIRNKVMDVWQSKRSKFERNLLETKVKKQIMATNIKKNNA